MSAYEVSEESIKSLADAIESLCNASAALMEYCNILEARINKIEDDPIRTVWREAEKPQALEARFDDDEDDEE